MNDIHVPTVVAQSLLCDRCHELPLVDLDTRSCQFICDACIQTYGVRL